jgi:predicted secreted protein
MRLTMVTFLMGAVLLVYSSSCAPQDRETVAINESQNHGEVHLKRGQHLVVSLPAQLGTGYSWREQSGQIVDGVLRSEPIAKPNGSIGLQPGGTEKQRFQFAAVKDGTEVLSYVYVQPWMHDQEPTKRFSVKVVVD